MTEVKEKKSTAELVFGIHNHGDNLYSAKILKVRDNKVTEWKHGVETSLGHALHIAEDLMGAYIVQAHEKSAEQFYNEVTVI